MLCRRGRAAASGAATRLATQLLAVVPRLDVLIRITHSVAWIKPRVAGVFPFFSLNLTADSHHSTPKFTSLASLPIDPSTPIASPSS